MTAPAPDLFNKPAGLGDDNDTSGRETELRAALETHPGWVWLYTLGQHSVSACACRVVDGSGSATVAVGTVVGNTGGWWWMVYGPTGGPVGRNNNPGGTGLGSAVEALTAADMALKAAADGHAGAGATR